MPSSHFPLTQVADKKANRHAIARHMGNSGGGAASLNTSIAAVACLSLFTHATSCGSSLRSSNQIPKLTKKILQKIPNIQAYFKLYNFFWIFFHIFLNNFENLFASHVKNDGSGKTMPLPCLVCLHSHTHTHPRTQAQAHTHTQTHS